LLGERLIRAAWIDSSTIRTLKPGVETTGLHLNRDSCFGYGVNNRSFTEQYLDSTGIFKEAVIGILAAVAKQERVLLSERTIAGLQRARPQGRFGGWPKAEDADPKLVTKIARLRAQRRSIRAVAAAVKKSPNTVLRLLLPAVNAARQCYRPSKSRDKLIESPSAIFFRTERLGSRFPVSNSER
jgi:hypothetical protein